MRTAFQEKCSSKRGARPDGPGPPVGSLRGVERIIVGIVEAAVGAATFAVGLPLVRGEGVSRRALGALLTIAGCAAIAHAALSLVG